MCEARATAARLLTLLAAATGTAAGAPIAQEPAPVVVYLVRHGETEPDGTRDPALSEVGRRRARLLARTLAGAGLTRIHSTDLRRTRATAAPVLDATALPLDLYDPTDPDGFARRLAATPGRHLVLGHSNTTPALVRALGGEPGEPIADDEHDRLYVVVLGPGGPTTLLLRYGASPTPP